MVGDSSETVECRGPVAKLMRVPMAPLLGVQSTPERDNWNRLDSTSPAKAIIMSGCERTGSRRLARARLDATPVCSWLHEVRGSSMAAAEDPATFLSKFLREIAGCVFDIPLRRFICLQQNAPISSRSLPLFPEAHHSRARRFPCRWHPA